MPNSFLPFLMGDYQNTIPFFTLSGKESRDSHFMPSADKFAKNKRSGEAKDKKPAEI